MDHRSPARFLAPLALVGVILALFLVVKASSGGHPSSGPSRSTSTSSTHPRPGRGAKRTPKARPKAATYRVSSGDTLQAIAVKTGVSLEVLRELNPAINPQALVVGQIIKLKG